MKKILTQRELEEVLDQAVEEVTERAAGVRLRPGGADLEEAELCSVHIPFSRGALNSLTLCADRGLLLRMARHALREEAPSPQDLEDFAKEYFNILCGKIAAVLYRDKRTAVRFGVPSFYLGRYAPKDQRVQLVRPYVTERREGAQLIHHVPRDAADPAAN